MTVYKYHFLFFLGFLIFKLARGIGILSPSSAGSVILTIFLIKFNPLFVYLTSFNLSYEIFGVKFSIIDFRVGCDFIWVAVGSCLHKGAGLKSKVFGRPGFWFSDRVEEVIAISQAAQAGNDALAVKAVELFVSICGAYTGNVALIALSFGGVVLVGRSRPL